MEQELFLEMLEKYARPIMLTAVKPDSCVAMTRCAIEVLGVFGLYAVPAQVELIVMNKKMRELADAGKIDLEDRLPDWAVIEGAWSVGIGVRPTPEQVGHIVAIYEDYMIDLSLDQAHRPNRNIIMKPSIFKVEESFNGTYIYELNECYLVYHFRPDLQRWKGHIDWRMYKERYTRQTAQIVKAIRKELELSNGAISSQTNPEDGTAGNA